MGWDGIGPLSLPADLRLRGGSVLRGAWRQNKPSTRPPIHLVRQMCLPLRRPGLARPKQPQRPPGLPPRDDPLASSLRWATLWNDVPVVVALSAAFRGDGELEVKAAVVQGGVARLVGDEQGEGRWLGGDAVGDLDEIPDRGALERFLGPPFLAREGLDPLDQTHRLLDVLVQPAAAVEPVLVLRRERDHRLRRRREGRRRRLAGMNHRAPSRSST
mmetsp:Transcript_9773/g.31378  ORF Transcript_9773/g.31378 Transcript_9773/m.31378 type:complete len:216 (-) Transcript_9773:104-751(-)